MSLEKGCINYSITLTNFLGNKFQDASPKDKSSFDIHGNRKNDKSFIIFWFFSIHPHFRRSLSRNMAPVNTVSTKSSTFRWPQMYTFLMQNSSAAQDNLIKFYQLEGRFLTFLAVAFIWLVELEIRTQASVPGCLAVPMMPTQAYFWWGVQISVLMVDLRG